MNVLSIVMLVVIVGVVLYFFGMRITGGAPSVFGYYFFRVSSDSMEPTLSVGDVILVKSTPAEDILKDDIITFKSEEGATYGREVTHRVVEEPEIKNGEYFFQTQGDAQGSVPDSIISYDQVQGKFLRKLTVIGAIYGFFSTPVGLVILIAVILLLFGYELISILISNKKIDEADEALFASYDEKLNRLIAKEREGAETDDKNESDAEEKDEERSLEVNEPKSNDKKEE